MVPEGGSLYQHNMTMIVDGHTTIEHAVPLAPLYDDAVGLFAGSSTYYTPTLVVAFGGALPIYRLLAEERPRSVVRLVPRDERDVVLEYFERLNRARPQSGGS